MNYKIAHNLNEMVGGQTEAVVIGDGMYGMAIANELAKRGLKVEGFGKGSGNATLTAGAQVYPHILGRNPLLDPEEAKLLPYEIAYLPSIFQHLETSMAAYAKYSEIETSGAFPTSVIEMTSDEFPMESWIKDLMNARKHSLEFDQYLYTAEGWVPFTDYFSMASYSIDTLAHYLHLKKEFIEHGGVWHNKTLVSKGAIQSFDQGVLIAATGPKENELRENQHFPIYTKMGMSAIYRTEEQLPSNPLVGYDDYSFRPHKDDRGVTIAGFEIPSYNWDPGKRFTSEETADMLAPHLKAATQSFGPWEGLPRGVMNHCTPQIRFGVRSMGTFGMMVEQDRYRPNQIWVNGAGTIGISLVHGVKKEVADFVEDINKTFVKGMPQPNELLLDNNPDIPYQSRTSMWYREQRPSNALLEHESEMRNIDMIAASIALRRSKQKLRDEYYSQWI